MLPTPSKPSLPRMRPDLLSAESGAWGERRWVVKDPVRLRYFQLAEEEYAVLHWLNGRASAPEIRRRFERRFAPRELTPSGLQSFVAQLHGQGLLISDAPGQGAELLRREQRQRRWRKAGFALQLLAIRFRGFDPQPRLDKLAPLGSLLFSRAMALIVALLCLAAGLLVATQFETIRAQAPTLEAFFSGRNAWLLLLAVAGLKVCHEFGHALACRGFGGECHEMGVMLLAGVPCLYCNVSDSWLLPQRWRRLAISAAGMYVELLIAALATFAWWFSEPGWLHALCWNLVIVASINTVLINGNPLLKYDGYYMLSDVTGVPNLWRQSQEALRGTLSRWLLGIELYPDRWAPRRGRCWLLGYALAALAYRWFVMFAILWMVYQFLTLRRWEPIAQAIVALTLVGVCLGPVWSLYHLLRDPVRRYQMSRLRPLVSLLLLFVVVGAALATPFPYRVPATAIIQPADAARVFVSVAGTLREALPAGTRVAEGDLIATLENSELDLEIARLEGAVARQRMVVDGLQAQRELSRLPTARAALADFERQWRSRKQDHAALALRAPRAGVVAPPPAIPRRPTPPGELPTWDGDPLEPRNQGAYLTTGTLVALIGDPQSLEAVLTISQDDVELVEVGQSVRLWFDESPASIVEGEVVELARVEVRIAPSEWAMQNREPTRTDASGALRPVETRYHARVKLADHDLPLRLRSGGDAKITVASRSLAWRAWRFLQRTFRFDAGGKS